MMAEFVCKHCGVVSTRDQLGVREVEFRNGTKHLEARCPDCGTLIQYLPQGGPAKLYFGKHQGKALSVVAVADIEYLRWLVAQPWLKPTLRDAVRTAIEGAEHDQPA